MRLSSRGQSLEGQIFYICVNDVIIFVLVTFVFFVPSLAFSWLHLFSSSGSLVLSSQLSSVQVHFLHLLCLRAFLTSQTCLPPPSSPPQTQQHSLQVLYRMLPMCYFTPKTGQCWPEAFREVTVLSLSLTRAVKTSKQSHNPLWGADDRQYDQHSCNFWAWQLFKRQWGPQKLVITPVHIL